MKRLALIISALSLIPAASLAQEPKGARSVTLTDFQAKHRAKLMAVDQDRDGRLSAAEWATRPAKMKDPQRGFLRLDTNGDGYLDAAEIDARLGKRFAKLDANGDGSVSRDERMAQRSTTTSK